MKAHADDPKRVGGLVAVLAVVAAGLGYLYYQARQSGIVIQIGDHGVTIDSN
ncbi:hypothetical protein [Pseudorhodobacter antarcticus]|uniref:hypothetical protein n=1 Tax=Pseudorhodobacter antarcticus TaxID=1077947 RepID=UPI000AA3F0E6|nr:hypothetical protein [Pseudorhodobacter antarcticus]